MKNIDFVNNELKKEYKNILMEHPGLSGVMLYEFKLNEKAIKIEKIIHNEYGISITINDSSKLVIVSIDFLKHQIKVNYPDLPYVKIFDNYSRKLIVPNGYEYQKNERIIFRKYLIKLNSCYGNKHILILKENNIEYGIRIINGKDFNINDFINELLNYDKPITNIKELLLIISNLIDLVYFDLKLSDNKGNLIKITYNMLADYIEYRESEFESDKIYLKNNEFIIERRIKEKYNADIEPLMKKIGVYNGKEKR